MPPSSNSTRSMLCWRLILITAYSRCPIREFVAREVSRSRQPISRQRTCRRRTSTRIFRPLDSRDRLVRPVTRRTPHRSIARKELTEIHWTNKRRPGIPEGVPDPGLVLVHLGVDLDFERGRLVGCDGPLPFHARIGWHS